MKSVVKTVHTLLTEDGQELKTGKRAHKGRLPPGYTPELNVTKELDADRTQ